MKTPTSEPLPEKDECLVFHTRMFSPARRRRRKRMILPGSSNERAAFLEIIAHTATPSADFFLMLMLSGVIAGAAILLDAQPLYVLAALAAPFMAPVMGLSLASVFGSGYFFVRTLGALLVGASIVFAMGAAAGYAARLWPALEAQGAWLHARFSWADLILLTAGAVFTTLQMLRGSHPYMRIASAALAYELVLPVAAAGYGLTSGSAGLWTDGLSVFLVHLVLAALIGAILLAVQGLRPRAALGYMMGCSLLVVGIAGMLVFNSSSPVFFGPALLERTATPSSAAAFTPAANTPGGQPSMTTNQTNAPTQSITASQTHTPTHTPVPSKTRTPTITLQPTQALAIVRASGAAGAFIRIEPAGEIVQSILNGMQVEILPDHPETVLDEAAWVYIRTEDGIEGWMLKSLLDTRTPTALP